MAIKIDFNADMGEGFGMYKLGFDDDLAKYITSANLACGFHAGDPLTIERTVRLCEAHGVGIGAQPSYPDLMGFGRRFMAVSPEEAKADVTYQIGALQAFTKKKKLQHVKPHGAMYNAAVKDLVLARAICQAVKDTDPDMIIVALAGSQWVGLAHEMGLRVAREAFADRAFNDDGTLVPRTKPGAVIHDVDEVVKRSVRMVTQGKATSINGKEIDMRADSLCLHGDTPGAVEMARKVKDTLLKSGVQIVPMAQLV